MEEVKVIVSRTKIVDDCDLAHVVEQRICNDIESAKSVILDDCNSFLDEGEFVDSIESFVTLFRDGGINIEYCDGGIGTFYLEWEDDCKGYIYTIHKFDLKSSDWQLVSVV